MYVTRRNLIKNAAVVTGAIALSGGVGACGASSGSSGSAKPGGPVSGNLSIYSNLTGSKKDAADALYAAFKKANPKINFTLTEFGDIASSNTKLLSAITSGVVPDLVLNHYYMAPAFASHLVNLDDRLKDSTLKLDSMDKRVIGSGIFEGKRISLPMFDSSRTLMYNGAHLKKAGLSAEKPPSDWADLREWAKALTIRKGGTLVQAGLQLDVPPGEYSDNVFTLLLWGAGGELVTEDGKKAAFNSEAGRAALSYWHDLIHVDRVFDIGFTGPGGNNPFVTQKAALTYGLNPIAYFADQAKLDFGSVPIPSNQSGKPISMSDPFSLYMLSGGKNTEAAWRFIEFASSYDQQVKFCSATYSLPSVTKAQHDPDITALTQLKPFVSALEYAKPLPVIPGYAAFWDALDRHLEAALTNKVSVTSALADAEKETNAILSR